MMPVPESNEPHGVGAGSVSKGESSPLDGFDDFWVIVVDESPSVVAGVVEHPGCMSLRLNARSPSMFVAVLRRFDEFGCHQLRLSGCVFK